ncbi:MAG: hypothetical protein NTU85_02185 [Candidatus Kaiserbacteria bacterium]|nr:hypothetical protein [Candidatus Kaiserbacteria bacterium]
MSRIYDIANWEVGPITASLQKKYKEVLHGVDSYYKHLLTILK